MYFRTPSPSNEREISGTEALDAFVTGLYNETFNIVAALVNRYNLIVISYIFKELIKG